MNIDLTGRLKGVVEFLIESSSRINEAKPQKYWYPLSMATYGVEEILQALDSMCNFRTTMWEKTREFEQRFAEYQGCREAVMVNSGSSADLLLSFLLTSPPDNRLKPGDEILVPVVTWPTQVWSPLMAGLKVRFVDVDPATLNLSIEDLERKISPKTKAIFLVHVMGNPCDMDRVLALAEKHGLPVIEDCCESLGSEWDGRKVGNFGVGSAYSFFFSHHMTTMEGGMVVTDDAETADRLRVLRAHGWLRNVEASHVHLDGCGIDPRYAFVNWGFNVRPTDLQAGFGLEQLKRLPGFTERRLALAARFFAFVDRVPCLSRPAVGAKAAPIWMSLPIMLGDDAPFSRDEITAWLEGEGIETRPIIAGNLQRQPVAKLFDCFDGTPYPGADRVHDRGFYIGLSPMTSDETMGRLIERFEAFLRTKGI
ncbi:MAG TPA: DegT/DnrJ/EryC1/StrS family aminotransferase [Candidatus Deferrimicrobiaceae bacterium]